MSDERRRSDRDARAPSVRPKQRARLIGRDPFAPTRRDLDAEWSASVSRIRERMHAEVPRASLEIRREGSLVRLLPREERERLAAFGASLGDGRDAFGLSFPGFERTYPLAWALYRGWFRVKSRGHENLPAKGPAVIVANHGGLLPFDGAMLMVDVLRATSPPRLPRPLLARFAQELPFVRDWFAATGSVGASRENLSRLLAAGELALVFPEGVEGIKKPLPERYRLQHFHRGFARAALAANVPVIPAAIVGPDDQAPILYDVEPLARRLGLPVFPITPTFPWLGPLGLLPLPVPYRIAYGEPIDLRTICTGDDEGAVEHQAAEVRLRIQRLLDRVRSL
jgi:1-acyl-sn-glycerol-3-phosphate acyltransferase